MERRPVSPECRAGERRRLRLLDDAIQGQLDFLTRPLRERRGALEFLRLATCFIDALAQTEYGSEDCPDESAFARFVIEFSGTPRRGPADDFRCR